MRDGGESFFQGVPISDGILIGKAYIFSDESEEMSAPLAFTAIKAVAVDEEIGRFRRAIFSSQEELRRIRKVLENDGSKDAVEIIASQVEMLEDPLITGPVEARIREKTKSESAFHFVMKGCEEHFLVVENQQFRECRLGDIADLSKRVLSHLTTKKLASFTDLQPGTILFIKEITPSEAASLKMNQKLGVVTRMGLASSHAGLIMRAKGIPSISAIALSNMEQINGATVILDGKCGELIVNPLPETLTKYRKLLEKENSLGSQVVAEGPVKTADGREVTFLSNAGTLSDVKLSAAYGASGIGLFRTELLYLENPAILRDEQAQFTLYLQVIQQMENSPIHFRLFDLGGDKGWPFPDEERESNPLLGTRGIRLLLKAPELLDCQLRALLRAAEEGGEICIIVPFVSKSGEMEQVRSAVQRIGRELGLKRPLPLIGCMVELPSSALTVDLLAAESDFFSLGTNDLIQYTLSIDRAAAPMSDFFYSCQPAVLRLIKRVIADVYAAQKELFICGDVASNALFIPLLIGLGGTRFSCLPRYLPNLLATVRKISHSECQTLAERILCMSDVAEISDSLLQFHRSKEEISHETFV